MYRESGSVLSGYELPAEVPAGMRADALSALPPYEHACDPASPETILAELTRLKVATKRRDDGQGDLTATFAVYAEALSEYPADVVIRGCREWATPANPAGMWWPSLAELRTWLDARAWPRTVTRDALRRIVAAPVRGEPAALLEAPAEPDKGELAALLAETKRGLAMQSAAQSRRQKAAPATEAPEGRKYDRAAMLASAQRLGIPLRAETTREPKHEEMPW